MEPSVAKTILTTTTKEPQLGCDVIVISLVSVTNSLRESLKKVKFGLLAEPPMTPPPSPYLGPVIRLIFLLFYSKHEKVL